MTRGSTPGNSESGPADRAAVAAVRVWRPGRPVPLGAVLGPLQRGPGDPSHRRQPDGVLWRATRTPDGPVLLRLAVRPADGEVHAHAWGPGAGWALDGVPELLGDADDPRGFAPAPEHRVLVEAHRTRPGWRVPRSRAVFEALAAAALEQRVTGVEAWSAWRRLVLRYGEVAPGPAGAHHGIAAGLRVPPAPRDWAAIPSWEWLRAGVEAARRQVVIAAAAVAGRLEATVDLPGEEAARSLRTVPGVGVWTAAEVRQRAHGDADAFSWADYHVSRNVTWALTGRVQDDAACAALIERYRGHRFRVQRLLELAGAARPRHGPRMTLPSHLPGGAGARRVR
ncbi:MAG TPA: DNA-3-methyladenine glycosylase 2 family protein [Kineosporiaceae bacterium]